VGVGWTLPAGGFENGKARKDRRKARKPPRWKRRDDIEVDKRRRKGNGVGFNRGRKREGTWDRKEGEAKSNQGCRGFSTLLTVLLVELVAPIVII
jgi:hypothetical protein